MSAIRKLHVLTQELSTPDGFDLTRHLPDEPVAFLRNSQGMIGFGEAITFEASGAGRISELALLWREQVAKAEIRDPVAIPGTGLVGFGSISFADSSTFKSKLIIPKIILGNRDGRTWLTKIWLEGDKAPGADFYKTIQKYRNNSRLQFVEGSLSSDSFKKIAAKAIAKIKSGKIHKMVLARDIMAKIPDDFDLRSTLRILSKRYPSCWVYSIAGSFGASPELLVRVSHGQVSARVLAGTTARGTTSDSDRARSLALLASEKNLAEHEFAVESMVMALSPFCQTVDADEKPFTLALPDMWHLASDVYGKLKKNISVLDLASFLHPTAAVAGTPRANAQQLIEKLEPFDRGYYSGPVGWIGADGDGEWAIALRGAMIEEDVLTAYAGCGLVRESDPVAELAETELKFAPIRNALS